MTGEHVSLEAVEAFYRACLTGIRYLDDCRHNVNGSNNKNPAVPSIDKIEHKSCSECLEDLLLSLSSVWGLAFSPAQVFQFSELAAEEIFGPDWPVLPRSIAEKLIEEAVASHYENCVSAFNAAANAWNLKIFSLETGNLKIDPHTGLIVAGPSALSAAVKLFSERSDLDWGKQVVAVAGRPDTRHIAGLAGFFVQSRNWTRLLSPSVRGFVSPAYAVYTAGLRSVSEILVSPDAEPSAAEFAQSARDGI